jgi:hypothetical protein
MEVHGTMPVSLKNMSMLDPWDDQDFHGEFDTMQKAGYVMQSHKTLHCGGGGRRLGHAAGDVAGDDLQRWSLVQ